MHCVHYPDHGHDLAGHTRGTRPHPELGFRGRFGVGAPPVSSTPDDVSGARAARQHYPGSIWSLHAAGNIGGGSRGGSIDIRFWTQMRAASKLISPSWKSPDLLTTFCPSVDTEIILESGA